MNWQPTSWQVLPIDPDGGPGIQIDYMISPFYEGAKYAVRQGGNCLNVKGKWEYEPSPSGRTDAFYKRCRFDTLEAAKAAIEMKMASAPA